MNSPERLNLTITCLVADECTVYFEPYGSYFRLTSDEVFRVTTEGPRSGEVEVSYRPDGIVIGLYTVASVRVVDGRGNELGI
jgi:hypothetical protein